MDVSHPMITLACTRSGGTLLNRITADLGRSTKIIDQQLWFYPIAAK
jgi:hypothetical protein